MNSGLSNLFRFVGWRHLRLKPTRTLLTTLGVSLGIALYVAIQIINRSTLASFKESIDSVAGKATITITAGESGFSEEKLEIIQKVPGVKHAVPMVESRAYFASDHKSNETLVVLGVDMLKEQGVRTYKSTDEEIIDDPLVFLNQPDSVIVTHSFAKSHGFKLDSQFEVATARGVRKFTVRGLLSPEGPAKAYGGAIAIMDIDGARVTFGKENKLDRVDIVTREGAAIEDVRLAIKAALGAGYFVERPETQNEEMQRMVASFQVMLTFFSTLALLVGLFLITNSINIAVAERKREIGTLRALGATRAGILALFLSEAVAMGIIGAFGGAWIGRLLASAMVDLVTHSMSSQYLTRIEVATLQFTPDQVIMAVALGGVAAFVAALWPSLRATMIQPLEAMRNREVGEGSNRLGLARFTPHLGFFMMTVMAANTLAGVPSMYPSIDPINQCLAMVGAALLGPAIVASLISLTKPLVLKFGGTISRLAHDNLLRNPRRTGSNVMSLMVGLILTIMIATVATSFRVTIVQWFDKVLRADLIVSSSGRMITYQTQPLHEEVANELATIKGLKPGPSNGIYGLRFVHVAYQGKQLGVKAYDEPNPDIKYSTLDVQDRPAEEAGRDLYRSPTPTLLVSVNFVNHFKKKTGDTIEIETPSGKIPMKIVGVVVDYASPEGILYISRQHYRNYWKDPLVNAFGLEVAQGVDPSSVRREIDERFGRSRSLTVLSNAELKQQMVETIDQSFAYTKAIEAAALLVGLLGLLNTLLISVMERMRELGMLRAVGMSRGQLARMILQEALVQGGFGAIAAVALGSWITYLWVTHSLAHVLGWMVHFHFPWVSVLTTVLVGVFVALIAGLLPSRRAAKIEIREALEYE